MMKLIAAFRSFVKVSKNEWSCTSSSPVCLHSMHRDNFYNNTHWSRKLLCD
jgi:hypothetical protein